MAWLAVLLVGSCSNQLEWPEVLRWVREEFPEVRQLQTEELASRLADSWPTEPLIVDARTPEEFEVSHLRGAVNVPHESDWVRALSSVDRGREVVVYCSVGYRSSLMAREMMAAGFEHVYNLEGSIFKWANEGRPIEREGQAADSVHPYDQKWGFLLDPRLRSE